MQYAAKELCTKLANPTRNRKARRYLREVEKVTWVMLSWKHDGMTVDVHVDSRSGMRGEVFAASTLPEA